MESIRYLALGDSYTIGTGLEHENQNFPSLLAKRLTEETGVDVTLVNLGVNGYTTADLIREELPVARAARPEIATVLIGANDIVQGSDETIYRTRLGQIYDTIGRLGLGPDRVLSISVPDFSALPGAAPFGSATELRTRIDAFNAIAKSEATARGFRYINITPITRAQDRDSGWIAPDGLHPGPAQQQAFADRIWEMGGWLAIAWDRWSGSAKRVLVLAQQEAESARHAYVGTEHLLLAILRNQGNLRPLLDRQHVDYRRVRTVIDNVLGRNKSVVPNPIPTSRVKRVMRIANQEASFAEADAVAPEHILVGLIVEGEGIAFHILKDLGITLERVRDELHRNHQPTVTPPPTTPIRGWTAAIRQWLDRLGR